MIKRLINILRKFFISSALPAPDLELRCDFDIEELAKDLKIEHLAIKAAKHNLPDTQSTTRDDAERKIAAHIQSLMVRTTNIVNEKLVRYNAAISNTNLNDEQQRIQNIAENTKLKLKSLIAEAAKELSEIRKDERNHAEYLEKFKKTNHLERAADYPVSRVFHVSLIAAMLLFESFANGYFFAQGDEYGWLGGWTQSIIVAVINIVPAALFAGLFFLRYVHHVILWKSVFASIFLMLYAAWVFIFNLGVAHYRDYLASYTEQSGPFNLGRVLDAPFMLADINSWLLFCVGIIFSLGAIYDGYKSDDAYPRYGSLTKRLYDIQRSYDSECERLGLAVKQEKESFLDELELLGGQVKDEFGHIFHLSELKKALIDKHRHCIDTLADAGDALIHKYRATNRMNRLPDALVPKYFNEEWKTERDYGLLGQYDDRKRVAEQRELYNNFPSFVEEKANEIEVIYTEFYNTLHELESSSTPSETIV